MSADQCCHRPVQVRLSISLNQVREENFYSAAQARGDRTVICEGRGVFSVPLVPHHPISRSGPIFPYRRLLEGPAELFITTSATQGRFNDLGKHTRLHGIVEHRCRRIGAHAARVRACIAIANTFVILRRAEG